MKKYHFILAALISGMGFMPTVQAGQLTIHNMALEDLSVTINGARQNPNSNEWQVAGVEANSYVGSGKIATYQYGSPKIGMIKFAAYAGMDLKFLVNNGNMIPSGFNDNTDVYVFMPTIRTFKYLFVNIPAGVKS